MKIGLLTTAFPKLSLEDIASWASSNGFEMLEIGCYPLWQEKEELGGPMQIDMDSLTPSKITEIKEMLARNNLEISALNYHPNVLDPDPDRNRKIMEHLRKVIIAAGKLGVEMVSTHLGRTFNPQVTGRDWYKDIDYNFELVMAVWPGLVKLAADNNVKIAIENCPMLWSNTWPGGDNLFYSPAIMKRVFKAIPDKNFGMNYDPSHFIFQFIDYIRFIYDFSDRIFHVHAQDMSIDQDILYEDGILNAGFRWEKRRLPGLGLVDWNKLGAALYDIGYDFVLSIENEDHNFRKTLESTKRGFLLAKKTLEKISV